MEIAVLHREAAALRPSFVVPLERFEAAVALALGEGIELEAIVATDLYLALACLAGNEEALDAFEHEVMDGIRPSVERACRDASTAPDDVLQSTREKLLVGADAKLLQYRGRGSLVGWVRVVAVREALQDRRRTKRAKKRDDEALLVDGTTETNAELVMLRARYADSFRAAVESALRRLTPEQRSILRFHTHDGLTIDQLAPMLGVHRATAARRLERARSDALSHTRAILRENLALSESEARSLCLALAREVDVSIGRALASQG